METSGGKKSIISKVLETKKIHLGSVKREGKYKMGEEDKQVFHANDFNSDSTMLHQNVIDFTNVFFSPGVPLLFSAVPILQHITYCMVSSPGSHSFSQLIVDEIKLKIVILQAKSAPLCLIS